MKRAAALTALLTALAGYVFLQTAPPPVPLAALMPGGAALYLEARDFSRLLREWDASPVKAGWLASENFAVFSRSNLLQKLQGVYGEYGAAAGFLPGVPGVLGIAGTQSALALYDLREVEFLYVTRIGEAQVSRSPLWAVRDRFDRRQAGGVTFYLRRDPASQRTVAFALANGWLFLATRDDLVARALALLAGGRDPSIASDRWYREAVAASPQAGELRMVLNLESLAGSVSFRSYWIQRNVSALRAYWTGVADVRRSRTAITESRVFLRQPDAPVPAADSSVAALVPLVPPDAGFYRAAGGQSAADVAALLVHKLVAPPASESGNLSYAPEAVFPDERAGAESDLETRIDEPPLPAGAGLSEAIARLQSVLERNPVRAVLQVQSSASAGGPFIRTPAVIVLAGSAPWDAAEVRGALASAAAPLWTASGLGAGWIPGTAGRHAVEQLDGLGSLMFLVRGPLLFVAGDAGLLASVLDRAGSAAPQTGAITRAAGFRHTRERRNFERVMAALDSSSPGPDTGFGFLRAGSQPPLFSGNLAGLSRVLSGISEVLVTEESTEAELRQTVAYRLQP